MTGFFVFHFAVGHLIGGSALLTGLSVLLYGLVAVAVTVGGHELGHVIAGWIAGYTFARFAVGSGRNLVAFEIGRTRCELNAEVFNGCVEPRTARNPDSAFAQTFFLLGGVIANVAMTIAALLLWGRWDLSFWGQVAIGGFVLCNLLNIALSLTPHAERDDGGHYHESDAFQLLRVWRVGPERARQTDYMTMVTPYFEREREPGPSRSAGEILDCVKALRSAEWRRGAVVEEPRKKLSGFLERGGLTNAETRLALDTLSGRGGAKAVGREDDGRVDPGGKD